MLIDEPRLDPRRARTFDVDRIDIARKSGLVGTDSEPLIHEYDTTHGAPQAIRAADVFEPATPIKLRERRSPNWSLAMIIVLTAARLILAATGVPRTRVRLFRQQPRSRPAPGARIYRVNPGGPGPDREPQAPDREGGSRTRLSRPWAQ